MKLKELRDQLNSLNKKLHDIHDAAESDNRALTKDERDEWSRLKNQHTDLNERIKQAEFLEANKPADELEQLNLEAEDRRKFEAKKSGQFDGSRQKGLTPSDRNRAFSAWGCRRRASQEDLALAQEVGFVGDTIELRFDRGCNEDGLAYGAPKTLKEVGEQSRGRAAWSREQRAQAVGTASAGGNTVPDEMMRSLERALLQFGGMRQVSTIISTATGADLPIPTTNDTSNVGEILAENTQVNEQDVTFGQIVLQAYKYSSKMVRVSVELMQDNSVNLPQLLGSLLGERLGRITNTHFTVGTGTGQPNGVVTAAADSGVTTASNAAITYSEIMSLKHSVDPAYRNGARWMMHDGMLLQLKEMADQQGRPLWLPGLIPGEPDTFDGTQIVINQDMPTGASAKAIIYGDFSKYYIRDTHSIELMRLDERYADFHQVAFLAFGRWDGDLIDAGTNPVKHLTLSAV